MQDTPSLDLYDAEGNLVEAGQESDGEADTPDGIPEPFEGLGKGKALTAGNAAGTGYITVAYNNDSSLGGLPVSLQVIKVECARNTAGEESPYRGNLLVIKSDNLFDEKLTLRHTGDFGGRPDNFTFDWWIAAVDDTAVSPVLAPPSYPWQPWTRAGEGRVVAGSADHHRGREPHHAARQLGHRALQEQDLPGLRQPVHLERVRGRSFGEALRAPRRNWPRAGSSG